MGRAATRPSLVVVDVSVEVAALCRLCGVPVVVLAMPGVRTDRAHALAYDLADALLAPWPEAAHTDGLARAWRDKLWAVGALSRFDGRAGPTPSAPGRVGTDALHLGLGARRARRADASCPWGGGGRGTSAAEVAAARAATPGWEWVERGPGSPSPDLWADLAAADVVVTHGGQNAVAEVAAARRPAVVVAQPRPFDEQVATAAGGRPPRSRRRASRPGRDAAAGPACSTGPVRRGGEGWRAVVHRSRGGLRRCPARRAGRPTPATTTADSDRVVTDRS